MKILVTGASGFIGQHICRHFSKFAEVVTTTSQSRNNDGYKTYQLNLAYGNAVKRLFEQEPNVDVIIHLSANPLTKFDSKDINSLWSDNVIATHNLAHHAPSHCHIIFVSSVVVYGDQTSRVDEYAKTYPTNIYGITKLASEHVCNYYIGEHKRFSSLRLCATVGTGLTHGIVKDFIRKIKEPGEYLEAFGAKPGTKKPFIHVDDVVSAIKLLTGGLSTKGLSVQRGHDIYNVCPSNEITVEEVGAAVMKGMNKFKPIKWLGDGTIWKGDNRHLRCYNQKLLDLGWDMKYPRSESAITAAVEEICQE